MLAFDEWVVDVGVTLGGGFASRGLLEDSAC